MAPQTFGVILGFLLPVIARVVWLESDLVLSIRSLLFSFCVVTLQLFFYQIIPLRRPRASSADSLVLHRTFVNCQENVFEWMMGRFGCAQF